MTIRAGLRHRRYHSRVPTLRPFRALRFNAAKTDLSSVLAPPYDIIGSDERLSLLAQDPHNAVRIDLPADIGAGGPADYQAAADTLEAWRRQNVLVMDEAPTVTIHEMRWRDADGAAATATGLFVRLKLEEFGPGSGVLPHERTLSGPKQDRYDLLVATELNTSPLVFLAGSDAATTSALMARLTDRPPDVEASTEDDVSHRLWICAGADDGVAALLELTSSMPITIADGHHRYETALTFRRDRNASQPDASDPAWDYVMALIYPLDQAPPALPTHRIVRGGPTGADLLERLSDYLEVEPVTSNESLLERWRAPVEFAAGASGTGRFGLVSGGLSAILSVRKAAIEDLLDTTLSAASKGLDANALTAIIEVVYGADPNTLVAAGRLAYAKDASDAVARVGGGEADTCFLLDPMPASAISNVAEAGEVMPQKSTYFNPKAPTGLLFSPLEW